MYTSLLATAQTLFASYSIYMRRPSPGGPTRDKSNPNPGGAMVGAQEKYSIDFMLLTQLSLTKGGLRRIKRELEGTEAEQLTNPYFGEVSEFFRGIVGHLEEVTGKSGVALGMS
eukprot:4360748-Amphidinium_carterae.1